MPDILFEDRVKDTLATSALALAVTGANIATDTITTDKIQDGAVTMAKMVRAEIVLISMFY